MVYEQVREVCWVQRTYSRSLKSLGNRVALLGVYDSISEEVDIDNWSIWLLLAALPLVATTRVIALVTWLLSGNCGDADGTCEGALPSLAWLLLLSNRAAGPLDTCSICFARKLAVLPIQNPVDHS